MAGIGLAGFILIIVNFIISYKGFKDEGFYNRYKFQVSKILVEKEYKRLITSSFLHTSWGHLIFNMISLWAFSGGLEYTLGIFPFLLIYFLSMVAGDALALFLHRNHNDYSSVGASGAVCGIIFAAIALFPSLEIGFIILPIQIPAWIYGIIFIAFTLYGLGGQSGNVSHEAHLGGALAGILAAIIIEPSILDTNILTILLLTTPVLVMFFIISRKPSLMLTGFRSSSNQKYYSIDHKYNAAKVDKQKQLDSILDKINRKGMKSLSEKERELLEEYAKTRT